MLNLVTTMLLYMVKLMLSLQALKELAFIDINLNKMPHIKFILCLLIFYRKRPKEDL